MTGFAEISLPLGILRGAQAIPVISPEYMSTACHSKLEISMPMQSVIHYQHQTPQHFRARKGAGRRDWQGPWPHRAPNLFQLEPFKIKKKFSTYTILVFGC